MALTLGTILYVAILLINAMAVLSEDRFLARSASYGNTASFVPSHISHQLDGHQHQYQR